MLRYHLNWVVDGLNPDECNWLGDVFGRNVESDESESKTKPDKEGDQPSEIIAMEDQSCDPPTEEMSVE